MIITPTAPPTPLKVSVAQVAHRTQEVTPRLPQDRWVSQNPPIPDPPPSSPVTDPWKEVPETVASSALHTIGAGSVGALIGALVAGPVGAAVGAGIGTALGQGFMQLLLGMADGGNTPRHRLGAAVPGALALAGGLVGGMTVGAMGVAIGVLAAPLLALAGYGVFWGLNRLK